MTDPRDMMRECWSCDHRRPVPGNAHIQCICPDPKMKGDEYGINNGWFFYPLCFDPVWKTKLCDNYKEKVK